jgi:flavin-dependent dehydrogenase
VGGGPAGLGLAGALALRGRSVAVFERSTYAEPRVGETFGGEVAKALKALGAWEAGAALAHAEVPFRATRAAWGSDAIEERSNIVHPFGEGWHVDRARFDERLAGWAERSGAIVLRGAGTCTVARVDDGFVVTPARGEPARARFFVDASGRGAPASARLGGRVWVPCDRQVALVGRAHGPARDEGHDLLLESAEDGWWYSVPQPDGRLVVALVTDADLVPAGPRAELAARFLAALARTKHTALRVGELQQVEVSIVRADTGRLVPDRGERFLAIGDAAMSSDPLAGNGVARALRSAAEAAEAVAAELDGAAPAPSELEVRFADHIDRRASYYALEARWRDARFWARRRPIDWRRAPLTLHPEATLAWDRDLGPEVLAPVEALLPPRAIASLRERLARAPVAAHAALAEIRALVPRGDRRLVVGVQSLIEVGVIRAEQPAPGQPPAGASAPRGAFGA